MFTRITVAVTLFAITVIAPTVGSACGEEEEPRFTHNDAMGKQESPAVSTDGTFLFEFEHSRGYEPTAVQLWKMGGGEVEGSYQHVTRGIYRFTPFEPTTPGEFRLYIGEEEGVYIYDPEFKPSLSPDFTLSWHEEAITNGCLIVDECWACGDCAVDWVRDYEYLPSFTAPLDSFVAGSAIAAFVVRDANDNERSLIYAANGGHDDAVSEVVYAKEPAFPVCVRYDILDDEENVVEKGEETCFQRADFPSYEEREGEDYADKIAQCKHEPWDTSDPLWQGLRSDDSSGGCSIGGTARLGTTSTSLVGAMALVLFAILRRRTDV